MALSRLFAVALAGLLLAGPAVAEEARFAIGGDAYVGGQDAAVSGPVANDAFAIGQNVSLGGPVGGDAHLFGFNVAANAPVTGNVYAAGFSISIEQSVGADLSVIGNSISVGDGARIAGNARLAGASVTVRGSVEGALIAVGAGVTLNGAVGGDMEFYGENLSFGPTARVAGNLVIHAPAPVNVPESVAPASRVRFEQLEDHAMSPRVPTVPEAAGWALGGAITSLITVYAVLFVTGLVLIALFGRQTREAFDVAMRRPFGSLVTGFFTGSTLLGLVPVTAMTLIGLPVIPIVLVIIVIATAVGYVSGVLFAAARILGAFMNMEGNGALLVALVVGLIVVGLLFFVPILGWLLALGLCLFGLGAVTLRLGRGWFAKS